MKEINLLKARPQPQRKFPFLSLLFGLLHVFVIMLVSFCVVYFLSIGSIFLLQQSLAIHAAQPPPTTQQPKVKYTRSPLVPSQLQLQSTTPGTTPTPVASSAATIPTKQDIFSSQAPLLSPTQLVPQLLDEISKITIYRLVDVLSAYWIDNSRFPSSENSQKDWIQQLSDIGDISVLYAKYLQTVSSPQELCNTPEQRGLCYSSNGQNALIFVRLTSPAEEENCTGNPTFFVWQSSGKVGVVCGKVE